MRLVIMGTGPFAVPTFNSLLDSEHEITALFTRPTRPARGRQKSPSNPMRDVAEARRIKVFAPESVNSAEARLQLAQLKSDLLVVCDYGQILSADTLATARLGGINLHGSLLPKYRGAAPVNWAIYHGETKTGVTVILMSPRLDAGPCLDQRGVDIDPEETAVQLEERLSNLGVQSVHEAIAQLADWNGESPIGEVQDNSLATKAPRLNKQDGCVDWSRTAPQIKNQVRAFQPWPNTFAYCHRANGSSLRLILDRVSVIEDGNTSAKPGRVIDCDGRRLWIATGAGTISLDRVQPSGKRVMAIDEFLRGHPVQTGDQFNSSLESRL